MTDFEGDFAKNIDGSKTKVKGSLHGHSYNGRITPSEGTGFTLSQGSVIRGENSRGIGDMFIKKLDNELPAEATGPEVIEKYTILRSLGVPVVPTLRFDQEQNTLLMTDITEGGKYKLLDTHHLEDIPNMVINNSDQVREDIRRIAKQAYQNGDGVMLSAESYAILIDKDGYGRACVLDIGRGSYKMEDMRYVTRNESYNGRRIEPEYVEKEANIFINDFL